MQILSRRDWIHNVTILSRAKPSEVRSQVAVKTGTTPEPCLFTYVSF